MAGPLELGRRGQLQLRWWDFGDLRQPADASTPTPNIPMLEERRWARVALQLHSVMFIPAWRHVVRTSDSKNAGSFVYTWHFEWAYSDDLAERASFLVSIYHSHDGTNLEGHPVLAVFFHGRVQRSRMFH